MTMYFTALTFMFYQKLFFIIKWTLDFFIFHVTIYNPVKQQGPKNVSKLSSPNFASDIQQI